MKKMCHRGHQEKIQMHDVQKVETQLRHFYGSE